MMKLKGGVIIIGSLIWENHLKNDDLDNLRENWRSQYLINKPVPTKVPIRYGRESQTRNDTYTMVFSTACEDNLGQGLILPFNKEINIFKELEDQAMELARAEGIFKGNNKRLTSTWGTVGLLINPRLNETDKISSKNIRNDWANIYNKYAQNFNPDDYKANEEKSSPITKDGFLNIVWQPEMNAFDLLIATPVKPIPKKILGANEIAQKMIEKNYKIYFNNNKLSNIHTALDNEIQLILASAELEFKSK